MTLRRPSPLTAVDLVDEYFIENRNRVLEVAAFLDRLDAAGTDDGDFRMEALREALAELSSPEPGRLTRIQLVFSDPTTDPRPALDRKGAVGAFNPGKAGTRP